MLTDMINNKFIRGKKLNISIVFITNHILKYQKMLD